MENKRKKFIAVLFICIILLAVIFFITFGNFSANTSEVLIDFSKEIKPIEHSALGFTFGFNAKSPSKDLLEGLNPQFVRGPIWWFNDTETAKRVLDMDTNFEIDLSDFGKNGFTSGFWPGENGDWSNWENHIDKVFGEIVKRGYIGMTVDITGEPVNTWNIHFKGDKTLAMENYLETWKIGCLKIKEIDSSAKIAGPSVAGYNYTTLKQFLLYCKENNVVPEILSWHEFDGFNDINLHVAEIREFLKQENIAIEGINIEEYGSSVDIYDNRADMIGYFKAFEISGITRAGKACWNEVSGVGGCNENHLDNLITYDGKPRTLWWEFKGYSELSGNIVESSDISGINILATKDKTINTLYILAGISKTGTYNLILNGVSDDNLKSDLNVTSKKIYFSGADEAKTTDSDFIIQSFSKKQIPLKGNAGDVWIIEIKS